MNKYLLILVSLISTQEITIQSKDYMAGENIALGAFYGAAAGISATLLINNVMIPWLSGRWEKERQDQEARNAEQQRIDAEHQRQATIKQAKQRIALTTSHYNDEISLKNELNKKQLIDIVTGRYGNHEFRFLKYDHELAQDMCATDQIDASLLQPEDQQKLITLLQQLRFIEKQKNLLLSQEIIQDQQRKRELDRSQAEFNARMNNQRDLAEIVADIKKVVRDQGAMFYCLETHLTNIGNAIRDADHRNHSHWNSVQASLHGLRANR